ncbi:MAG: transcription antitermination protein NusB [Patescibacteria group bacterium]
MRKLSRREVREFLLQALYARSVLGTDFSLENFASSYYESPVGDALVDAYFLDMYEGIVVQEGTLLQIVKMYAPKFDITIMPLVNLLPIFIGAYEMLYLKADQVPEKVSINEAVELAKKFSDDGARELVNGVLNSLKDQKNDILATLTPREGHFFSI